MNDLNGWIKLHRNIKKHWIWSSENRLKWWIDILLTVNHSEAKVLIKGTLIDCGKGQSIRSLQSWAEDWGVTKKTVSDFFKLLQKDNMILIENLKITTRITVCNYDNYNDSVNASYTPSKRQVNAEYTQATHKQEELRINKKNKNIIDVSKKSKIEIEKENEKSILIELCEKYELNGNSEKFIELSEKWFDYKREIKSKYKSKTGICGFFKNLVEYSKKDIYTAELIINKSIGSEYKGIFPLKQNDLFSQVEPNKINENINKITDNEKLEW